MLFYVDLSSKQTSKFMTESLIEPEQIKSRRIYRHTDPYTGFQYLIRAVFGAANSDNNYIEILNINGPSFVHPQTIAVIDRSLLDLPSLQVTDFRIYENRLFVLDL